jgi:hypothetical protein
MKCPPFFIRISQISKLGMLFDGIDENAKITTITKIAGIQRNLYIAFFKFFS